MSWLREKKGHNNFADTSKIVHETGEPIYITQKGYGDMVLMSMEAYDKYQFDSEIYIKLKEAEVEASFEYFKKNLEFVVDFEMIEFIWVLS